MKVKKVNKSCILLFPALLVDSLLSVKTVESLREEVSLHSRNLVLVLREDYIWIRLEVSLKVRMCYYQFFDRMRMRASSFCTSSFSLSWERDIESIIRSIRGQCREYIYSRLYVCIMQ